MTNLQQKATLLSPALLRRLWFGVPAAALGLLALLVGAGVLLPQWQTLQKDGERLRALENLQNDVSLMRQQLRAQDIQEEKALEQKDKLFRMIAGSGDVSTILAVLDREAKAARVQLDLVEPQGAPPPAAPAAPAAPPPPAGANQGQPPAGPNPLEMAGLQPQAMLISLRGPYANVLGFLRRLESLNVLVIQTNLRLEAPPQEAEKDRPRSSEVVMKLNLTLYGKPPAAPATAAPAAPGAPGTPPAAPAAGAPTAPPR